MFSVPYFPPIHGGKRRKVPLPEVDVMGYGAAVPILPPQPPPENEDKAPISPPSFDMDMDDDYLGQPPPPTASRTIQLEPDIVITCPAPLTSQAEGDAKHNEYKNASKYSPAGSRPHPEWHANETGPKKQKYYCGARPEITQATILQMCESQYNPEAHFYTNPYQYKRLGTRKECHRSGYHRASRAFK